MLIAEQVAERQARDSVGRGSIDSYGSQKPDGTDNLGFLPVDRLRRKYLDFLGGKMLEIEERKTSDRYYNGAQWTADEIKILRSRRQPVVTFNRIFPKINRIAGLMQKLRQDPKAYPNKPGGDEGAEVATAVVRYVCDANLWEHLQSEASRRAAIDGVSGIEMKLTEGDKGDPDIKLALVYMEDWFYDMRSILPSFLDTRDHGIGKWIDIEEAVELFPDKEDILRTLIEAGSDLTTYSDREFKWILSSENKVRLVEHWYKLRGKWFWAFYVSDTMLDEGESPFRDWEGKSCSRFVMFSANVDQDGDRYGFIRHMKSAQDELNQRRSRGLWLSNSKRLIIDKGAVDSVEIARREWSRPDGIIEKNQGVGDIKADDTQADLAAQLTWMQDARTELDNFANVQPFAPGDMPNNVSGLAVNLIQQAGSAELGPFILSFRDWKIRVYRMIWQMAQQFWTGQRWVRVTNDEKVADWIELNGVDVDEQGLPLIVNAVGALNVDIVLDEGPDVTNMMNDTFNTLSAMASKGANIPPQVLIELSPIQGSVKQRILKMLTPVQDPIEAKAKELEMQVLEATAQEKVANAFQRTGKAAESASKAHLNAVQIATQALQQIMQIANPQQGAEGVDPYPSGSPESPSEGVTQQPAPRAASSLPRAFRASGGTGAPPIRGARQARDGNWYVNQNGQYFMVQQGDQKRAA